MKRKTIISWLIILTVAIENLNFVNPLIIYGQDGVSIEETEAYNNVPETDLFNSTNANSTQSYEENNYVESTEESTEEINESLQDSIEDTEKINGGGAK